MQLARAQSYTYERRRPEQTTCYRVVADHLDTFLRDRQEEGRPVPEYIEKEFDAFLQCGILAHGFLRIKCQECDHEQAVAFSCKKRGFCPSCAGKRMAETAAHMVDHVLPLAPYRQFVVTFPITMRYWLQSNRKLYSKIHKLVMDKIHEYYKTKANNLGIKNPMSGAVSYTQRWGSALNLNPHMHVIALDGVYTKLADETLIFRKLTSINDGEVTELLDQISKRIIKYFKRAGYLDKEGQLVNHPESDELFMEHEVLQHATYQSIRGKIAFGQNAGKKVTKIGSGFGFIEEIPLLKGKRCASQNGFSLHAGTRIKTQDRVGLERLIRYIARGPLANERLSTAVHRGQTKVKLELKKPFQDGTTDILFTPLEFIEKLVALIPPPRSHLVRWSGVFASASPVRRQVVLNPDAKKGFSLCRAGEGDGFKDKGSKEERELVKNYSWARMLKRVFKIDVSSCQHCGGEMLNVSAILKPMEIKRYLDHRGLPPSPPSRAPPRRSNITELFPEG